MKKLLTIICIIALLVTLTSCDPGVFQFDYDELKGSVVRVEYIYYDNPDAIRLDEFLVNKKDKLRPFDFDKMEIYEVLSDEKLNDFFQDLSNYEFRTDWIHLDSPQGDSLRIIYQDESFEVLSVWENDWSGCYSGSFDSNGNVKRFIGWGIVREFFTKWFEV